MLPRTRALAALAALALAACAVPDTGVVIVAGIEQMEATVSTTANGPIIKGDFVLDLHLGPRAFSFSRVVIVSAMLQEAGQGPTIVPIIEVRPQNGAMYPATVLVNGTIQVFNNFDVGEATITLEQKTKLCDPTGIIIGLVLQDSLQNVVTPVFSGLMHPSGC